MVQPQTEVQDRVRNLIALRHNHPAWLLLASRRGPAVLGCLGELFTHTGLAVPYETAILELAATLQLVHEAGEIECDADYATEARRELRRWIRRGMIVERDNQVIATDALESALRFIDGLQERSMTSTASRLTIVQREIERLEAQLSGDQGHHEAYLQREINALQNELDAVRQGEAPGLDEREAVERIREVHNLAVSLRHDFRRVEDSYRAADRRLRESIINEQSHRGEIVDKLLDSHDQLLETEEGKVFDSFYQQLSRTTELDQMRVRLRSIVANRLAGQAISREQQSELRLLYARLLQESGQVMQARSRSERDVKGFLRTGLAAEHHRVGQLLNEIFSEATQIDWSRQAMRRAPSPLPPIKVTAASLPMIKRLRFKLPNAEGDAELDLATKAVDLTRIDEDFWNAFESLDRQALLRETRHALGKAGRRMSIGALADELPPVYDLESLSFWLTIALDADSSDDDVAPHTSEHIETESDDGKRRRFTIPLKTLTLADAMAFELEF